MLEDLGLDDATARDLLAEAWDAMEPEAALALVVHFLRAAGARELPPRGSAVAVRRDRVWPSAADPDQRIVLVEVSGWGTLVVAVALTGVGVSRAHALALRRQVEIGRESGPRAAIVAVGVMPRADADLTLCDGVLRGETSWWAIADALEQLGRTSGPARHLGESLARHGLDRQRDGVPLAELQTLRGATVPTAAVRRAAEDWLAALGREASALGLVREEHVLLTKRRRRRDPEVGQPWVCWETEAGGRANAFVGVVLDISLRRSVLLAGAQAWKERGQQYPDALLANIVTRILPAGVRLAVWRPDALELYEASAVHAREIDRRSLPDKDWEWRGLAVTFDWGAVEPLGTAMRREHLRHLEHHGPALADLVLQSDIDPEAPRPSASEVLATLSRWPDGTLPRSLPGTRRAFGWTEERLVNAWLRTHSSEPSGTYPSEADQPQHIVEQRPVPSAGPTGATSVGTREVAVEAPLGGVALEDLAVRVLEHLRKYDTLTEREVTELAGSPRAYRRLRRHLDQTGAPLQFEATPRGTLWRLRNPE
jgi:hypothetical protein